jgi:hypothetical protein
LHIENIFEMGERAILDGATHRGLRGCGFFHVRAMEIADLPRLGKRMIRNGESVEIYDASDAKPFGPLKS